MRELCFSGSIIQILQPGHLIAKCKCSVATKLHQNVSLDDLWSNPEFMKSIDMSMTIQVDI